MSDELPPHDITAEQGVLGCFLIDGNTVPKAVSAKLQKSWFYDLRHSEIFDAILFVHEAGTDLDVITLQSELKRRGKLDLVGGIAYLSELADVVPSPVSLNYYLNTVRECFGKRELLKLAHQTAHNARNGKALSETTEELEAGLLAVRNDLETRRTQTFHELVAGVHDRMDHAYKNRGQLNGLATGFYDIDKMLRGMKPGQFIVLGGATSRGKTSLAMNIVEHVAVNLSEPVGVFSMEMGADELAFRMVCSRGGMSSEKAEAGEFSERELQSITTASAAIHRAPIHIRDEGGLTISRVSGLARMMAQEHRVKLFVIDYLQLIRGQRRESRTVEVGEISRGLKALAMELRVPVLALAQLNRDYDKDGKRKPRLSDLRESGSIEQDADAVLFIHRPEIKDTKAEIIVAKNRSGRIGECELRFRPEITRFETASP